MPRTALRKLRPVSAAIFIAVLAALLAAPAVYGQSDDVRGVFGTVLSVTGDPAEGEDVRVAVDTGTATENLAVTAGTVVRAPGLAAATPDDLSTGDRVAVLAAGDQALRVAVRPDRPAASRHFVGLVVSADGEAGTVSLQDKAGHLIAASVPGGARELQPGDLVTAVLTQDLDTGALAVSGVEPALAGLARLESALALAQSADAQETFNALRQRLISRSASHLTILRGMAQQAAAPGDLVQQRSKPVFDAYSAALSRYDAGEPMVDVTGLITSVDPPSRSVIVREEGLESIPVTIPLRATLWRGPPGLPAAAAETWLRGDADTASYVGEFGGREAGFADLELGSRVRLWYGLTSAAAAQVMLLPALVLEPNKARELLRSAQRGEAIGRITDVSRSGTVWTIIVHDELQNAALTLEISPRSGVAAGISPSTLRSLLGSMAAVTFDPESAEVIGLDVLVAEPSPNDYWSYLNGVVYSLVRKVLPDNISILTPDGAVRMFNHTADTVIIRDGRRISIDQVRLGYVVRPNTQYERGSDDLLTLSIKSHLTSPVSGFIRGISDAPGQDVRLTISGNHLELTTLLVTESTLLTGPEGSRPPAGLEAGLRITGGAYNPISGEASRLELGPP